VQEVANWKINCIESEYPCLWEHLVYRDADLDRAQAITNADHQFAIGQEYVSACAFLM
jgi:hypothetical protein